MTLELGIPLSEYTDRKLKVQAALEANGLDAIIAYSTSKVQANVMYLTSYYVRFSGMQTRPDGSYYMFGSAACLLPKDDADAPMVLTDQPWDAARCKEMSIYPDTDFSDNLSAKLGPIIRDRGYKRVGIDNWYLFPAQEYMELKKLAPDVEFVPTHLMSEVRRVKSVNELNIMREAGRVGAQAIAVALDAVAVGGSEFEISLLCEHELHKGGDLHQSGQSIGGCGVHTATASHLPSRYRDRAMQPGEWIMLDVCPRVEGYCSDVARHRLVGDETVLDPHLRKMYDTTLLMSEEVRKSVRAGVSGWDLNLLAKDIAEQEGFGEYKIDLLGHGVGIDIHDIPDYYYSREPFLAGEVVTIEPCLLMPGVTGCRVEDTVLVTETGHEVLTESSRSLMPE